MKRSPAAESGKIQHVSESGRRLLLPSSSEDTGASQSTPRGPSAGIEVAAFSGGGLESDRQDEDLGRLGPRSRARPVRRARVIRERGSSLCSEPLPGLLHQQLHRLHALPIAMRGRDVRWLLLAALAAAALSLEAPLAQATSRLESSRQPATNLCVAKSSAVPDPIQLAQWAPPANACCTPYSPCPLGQPAPVGYTCWCPSPYGPINGTTCRL